MADRTNRTPSAVNGASSRAPSQPPAGLSIDSSSLDRAPSARPAGGAAPSSEKEQPLAEVRDSLRQQNELLRRLGQRLSALEKRLADRGARPEMDKGPLSQPPPFLSDEPDLRTVNDSDSSFHQTPGLQLP